ELAPQAIAPGVVHGQHLDRLEGPLERRAPELMVEHLPLLPQLLRVSQVLHLAAAAGAEVGTGRRHPLGRRGEHGAGLAAPEVAALVGDLGFDCFSRRRALDEDHPALDPRDGRAAVRQLRLDRDLHYPDSLARRRALTRSTLARPRDSFMACPTRN